MNAENKNEALFPARHSLGLNVLWIAAIALVYFFVARFSLSFIFEPEGIAAIWLPAGIFLSAILLTRRDLRPYLVAALFLTDLAAELLAGIPPLVSLVYSAALAGDALLGAWLLLRFIGRQPDFRQVRQFTGYLLLCILLSNALAAVTAALAAMIFLKSPFWSSWLWWWSSDGVGNLLVTPLVMSFAYEIKSGFKGFRIRRFVEGIVLIILAAFLNNYAFTHFLNNTWFILLLDIFIFPFLIWAAIRFSVLGTAAISAVLAVIIVKYAFTGSFANFGLASNLEAIILVQVYIAMAAIPTILLATVFEERKQGDQELRQERDLQARIAETSPVGIVTVNRDGQIEYANDRAEEILGLSKDRITQRFYNSPEWKNTALDGGPFPDEQLPFRQVQDKRKPAHNVCHAIEWPDGRRVLLSINAAPILNAAGQSEGMVASIEDITGRIRAEEALRESQERYRLISTVTSDYMFSTRRDASGNLILNWVTGAFEEITGYTFEEYAARGGWRAALHPDDLALDDRDMEKLCANQLVVDEVRTITKDGRVIWVRVYAHPIFNAERNELVSIYGAVQDITGRKQAEAQLAASEEKYRSLFENVPDGMYRTLPEGKFLAANPAFVKMFGYESEEELKHFTAYDLYYDPKDRKGFMGQIGKGDVRNMEVMLKRKDGRPVICLDNAHAVRDDGGAILYFEGTISDISERKQAEEAVRESEQKFKAIFMTGLDGIYLATLEEGLIVESNDAFEGVFGYPREEAIGRTSLELNLYADPSDRAKMVAELKAKGRVRDLELKGRKKSGEIITVSLSVSVVEYKNKQHILGMIRDITERKRAEEMLKTSEKRFRDIADNAQEWIWEVDTEGQYVYSSQVVEKQLGYPPGEILQKHFYDLFHPDDREALKSGAFAAFASKQPIQDLINRNVHKNGQTVWLSTSGLPLLDDRGNLLGYRGVDTDITERKQAEQALQESEERFRSLFENATIGIYRTTPDGRILMANPTVLRMLGYKSFEELAQRNLEESSFEPSYSRSQFRKRIEKEGEVRGLETAWTRLDGSVIFVRESSKAVRGPDGSILYYEGSVEDITERKQAEQELHAVSSRQEAILAAVPDIIMEVDRDKVYRWANESGFAFFGEDVIGREANYYFEGEQETYQQVQPLFNGNADNIYVESWQRRKDGQKRLLAWWCRVLKDEGGSVTGTLSTARDITERKQVENALQDSEEQLRMVTDTMQDMVVRTDLEGRILYASPSNKTVLGYETEYLVGRLIYDFMHPEDVERVRGFALASLAAQTPGKQEFRYQHADGHTLWLESTGAVIFNESGLPAGAVFSTRDITERKQTQTLQEALYRIAAAAESTTSLEEFYPQIHQIISSVMPAENFLITLYDEAKNILRFPYFKDAEDAPFMGGIQPARGLTAYVLRTGKSLLCTQAVHDELERQGEVILLGVPSAIWLGVPLVVEGKTIGVMVVQHYSDPKAYGEREQHMLEFVSTQVAIAINRKRAEKEIQQLNTTLEQRVEERTRDLLAAREKLVHQERLAVLGQLAGGVGHELRNPLGVINNSIYYLKLVQPDASAKVRQYLGVIEQEVHNAGKIISDLLDFAQPKPAEREPVAVAGLVRQTLERFPVPASVELALELPDDLPEVFADPRQVEQVLGNLVTNASQAMVPGTTSGAPGSSRLTVSATREKKMVAIAVKDTGTGITPENMKQLFEPLFTTRARGIGLGLPISKKLAEANGGRIEVESEVGQGSTFTVYLPVRQKGEPK